jgi:DNA-binding NtrC family response regulator
MDWTASKRAASRANGTKFGRPRKVDDSEHIVTAKRMKAHGHTARDIAKYLGVSRATFYRYLPKKLLRPRRGMPPLVYPRRGHRPTCSPPAGAPGRRVIGS